MQKSRRKSGKWRVKRRIAAIVLAVVLVAIVGTYLYIITRPPLEITVNPPTTNGGTINITIKNVSKENITFTNSGYDLVFERQEGSWPIFTWHYVADFYPSLQESRVLKPGESFTVDFVIDKTWNPAFKQSGRYRVGTHGVYAEFTLEWSD